MLTELAKQLGQFVALSYEPHGLGYVLRIPLSALEPSKAHACMLEQKRSSAA